MAIFEIQGQDGKVYEVDAPDEASAVQAFTEFQPPTIQEQNPARQELNDYYSSGIYAGEYNPLGSVMRSLDAGVSGIGDALTFGFGDEISGAIPGRDIQYERNRQNALRESNPVASTVGGLAGGLVGGAGVSGILPSVRMASAPIAGRILLGAGEGAAMGGVYGAGSGDNYDSRVSNAMTGGLIGGVAGGLVPAVISGASTGYRNVADLFSKNEISRGVGVNPEVARQLAMTLNADGTLGPQGMANMSRAGGEAMLADAGPNAQQVLDTAIQRGGPGAVLARQRVSERVGRDSQSLVGALDSSLGTPEGVLSSRNAIRQGAQQEVSDAYKLANSLPIDYASDKGRAVESIINRIPSRIKSGAIEKANERLAYDGLENMQIMADIAEDGSVKLREMPNVMQADAIKKALDDIVRDGTDEAGKLSADASFASRMARDLRDAVADAVPEYGTALKTAADPLSRQSAIDLGSKILRPGMTRDKLGIAVDGYTDAQRDALAQGVRSHIDDVMANVSRTVQNGDTEAREAYKAIRDLSSRANREKLEIALGAQRAKPLFDELDRAAQSFELQGRLANNSQTFARTSTNKAVQDMASGGGAISTLKQGEPLNASKRIIQALTGETPEAIRGREDAIFSEIADYLTRPASQAIPAFQAMQNFQTQTTQNALRSQEIARLLSLGRVGVYPAAIQGGQ